MPVKKQQKNKNNKNKTNKKAKKGKNIYKHKKPTSIPRHRPRKGKQYWTLLTKELEPIGFICIPSSKLELLLICLIFTLCNTFLLIGCCSVANILILPSLPRVQYSTNVLRWHYSYTAYLCSLILLSSDLSYVTFIT